jgi:hypothetical protein
MFSRRASRAKLARAVWRDETPIDWLPDPEPGRNLDVPNAWLLERTGRSVTTRRKTAIPPACGAERTNSSTYSDIRSFLYHATILPSLLTVAMATFRQVGAGNEYDILRLNDGGWE